MRKFLIAPSILSANLANLGEDVTHVVSAGADLIHFDVMDNHYVPNLSMGSMVLRSLRKYGITVPIDVHLMARPVDRLILDFVREGVTFISFHFEATDHVDRSLQLIKKYGCKAGLVFNPSTDFTCLEYVIDKIDMVILMSVNPGFGGQTFIPVILDKIQQVRTFIYQSKRNILLAVDGGIKLNNIANIARAGADVFIIGSEIFNKSNYNDIIQDLRLELSHIEYDNLI